MEVDEASDCKAFRIVFSAAALFLATSSAEIRFLEAFIEFSKSFSKPPLVSPSGSPSLVGIGGSPSLVGIGGSPSLVGIGGSPSLVGIGGSPSLVGIGGSPAVPNFSTASKPFFFELYLSWDPPLVVSKNIDPVLRV